jgi:hypothetical protein
MLGGRLTATLAMLACAITAAHATPRLAAVRPAHGSA